MTPNLWIALGILAFATILFVTEWLRVDGVAIGEASPAVGCREKSLVLN